MIIISIYFVFVKGKFISMLYPNALIKTMKICYNYEIILHNEYPTANIS